MHLGRILVIGGVLAARGHLSAKRLKNIAPAKESAHPAQQGTGRVKIELLLNCLLVSLLACL